MGAAQQTLPRAPELLAIPNLAQEYNNFLVFPI